MYTSGTTAKPKGIAHTTGGYLVGAATTHYYVFDLKPDTDVYWCAADVGWVTGHSYIVYGPLCNGATSVMYEGTPDFPDKDRWWSIIERYGVTILYTAPTAIRSHMKWGPEHAAKHDLSSLRLLGSVGEPINPEAWVWYHEHIGGERCPIVDTWWQTETGMILITPLPGVTTTKPGSATRPFPGVDAAVYNEAGDEVGPGGGGYLVLKRPWPAMLRGIYGDDARYRETYWSKYDGVYFAGDGARVDEDGDFWLLGRVDDVMNVSGHRISTIEVESALVDHHEVAEAAVAARNDATTGQAIVAFVTLKGGDGGLGREARGAAQPRRAEDRADREAGEHRVHARAAEDAQRQDHAPPAPRRRGEPPARRHDDARRPDGRRGDPRRAARTRQARRTRQRLLRRRSLAALAAAPCSPRRRPRPCACRSRTSGRRRTRGICRSTRTSGRRAAVTLPQRLALVGHMPTQVLYGERVRVLARQGGWTKIAVPDQPSPLDARGYPGWVRSWQLGPAFAAPLVVTAKAAKLPNGTQIGFGSQVPAGVLPASATRPLPVTRAGIVRTAEQFLGLHYLWGGLSAWGYDCSGLTWAVYRAHGITIPRDADAQFAAGRPVSLAQMLPGRPPLLRAPGRRARRDVHRRREDDRGAELAQRGAHRPGADARLPRRPALPGCLTLEGVRHLLRGYSRASNVSSSSNGPITAQRRPEPPITSCATRWTSSAVTASRPARISVGSAASPSSTSRRRPERSSPFGLSVCSTNRPFASARAFSSSSAGTGSSASFLNSSAITSTASSARFRSTPACA